MSNIVVCALYKFFRFESFEQYQAPLLESMRKHSVYGTLLLAKEGVNGTISGERANIDTLLAELESIPGAGTITFKESYHNEHPFKRPKVKLKKEIVTMGVDSIDPEHLSGTYVSPKDWNALIEDPEVLVVDTRNDYEVKIGTFKNAINPKTNTFREFPEYVDKTLSPKEHKRVAMFCTGGIRCEKSTAYLKEHGFDEVYHLEGGILKYLEEIPEQESLWQGDCFVFDERVAVDHQLQSGKYQQCFACRMPLTKEQIQSPHYKKGISCEHCIDALSDDQKGRFAQREKQIQLAKLRGEKHMGENPRK